jgi:hypothetical protein
MRKCFLSLLRLNVVNINFEGKRGEKVKEINHDISINLTLRR